MRKSVILPASTIFNFLAKASLTITGASLSFHVSAAEERTQGTPAAPVCVGFRVKGLGYSSSEALYNLDLQNQAKDSQSCGARHSLRSGLCLRSVLEVGPRAKTNEHSVRKPRKPKTPD